jgi:hypothetical protein
MTEWVWDITKSFIGAGFGTAAMTAAISILRDRGQRRSEATYLALRLAVAFERYTADCNELIVTNNNAWTPPDEEFPDWATMLPDLAPFPTDGEGWKALGADLASDCLNLPNRIREGQATIAETIEYHSDGVGEAVDGQACACGLQAWELAVRLRDKHGIKAAEPAFDYVGHLRRKELKLQASRAEDAANERSIFAAAGPGMVSPD